MQQIPWETLKEPHPNALNNLNRLVSTLVEHGYVSVKKTVSANKLADLSGVHRNLMSNLLDRPGFVRVWRKGQSIGWYWDLALGLQYPIAFDATAQIIRDVQTDDNFKGAGYRAGDNAPTSEPYSFAAIASANRTMREQLRAQDLLENNQVIITFDDAANIGIATYNDALQMLTKMLDSMIQLESPPERYATAIYQMSKHLHDGTFKISRE